MTGVFAVFVMLFLSVVAFLALVIRDFVTASFFFALFSVYFAFVWLLLAAVDVGFTETVVGAGAASALFFMTLSVFKTPKEKK